MNWRQNRQPYVDRSGYRGRGDRWAGAGPIPQRGGTGTWTNEMPSVLAIGPRAGLIINDVTGVLPGDVIQLAQVVFTYQGPSRRLAAAFAAKTDDGQFINSFNKGALTLDGAVGLSDPFSVPAASSPTEVNQVLANCQFPAPKPATYRLRGGGQGTIHGHGNIFSGAGSFKLWVWVVDYDQIAQDAAGASDAGYSLWLDDGTKRPDGNNKYVLYIQITSAGLVPAVVFDPSVVA